jgi:hypothetical protein
MNSFSVKDFVSRLNNTGTLQTNKFNVLIRPPGRIGNAGVGNLSNHLIYRADSVRIPGVTIDPITSRRYGVGISEKTATNISFQDLSISFLEDAGGSVHKYFYKWFSSVFNFTGTGTTSTFSGMPRYTAKYKDSYSTTIIIYVYDNTGKLVNEISILEAFPIAMGDINLAWAENNTLMKVNVSFAYSRWVHNVTSTTSFVPQLSGTIDQNNTEKPKNIPGVMPTASGPLYS